MPFEVFKDEAGEYRWRLVAGNNEIVAQSEAYTRPEDAVRGAGDATRAVLNSVSPTIHNAEEKDSASDPEEA